MYSALKIADDTDRAICSLICRSDGIKAREIARRLCQFEEEVERENYLQALAARYFIREEALRTGAVTMEQLSGQQPA